MNFRPRSARLYVREGLASDAAALLPLRSALVLHGRARSAGMRGIDPATSAGCGETRFSAIFRTLPSRPPPPFPPVPKARPSPNRQAPGRTAVQRLRRALRGVNGEGIERGSPPVRQPIVINQDEQETTHGFRTQHGADHWAPRRRRDHQPPGLRRARRQYVGGDRRDPISIARPASGRIRPSGTASSRSRTGWSTCWRSTRRRAGLVYVSGKLQTRSWRKDGEDSDRYSTEILLVPGGRVQFLEKPDNGNGAPPANGESTASGTAAPADPTEEIPF